MDIEIRNIKSDDCKIIADSFKSQNWRKPIEQYQTYFKEQQEGNRLVLVAF